MILKTVFIFNVFIPPSGIYIEWLLHKSNVITNDSDVRTSPQHPAFNALLKLNDFNNEIFTD